MDKLSTFLKGVAGSANLLNRAWECGAFIECVCIMSNQIDALLRIGIILNTQLKEDNSIIIDELIYQDNTDKKVSEKDIYSRALNEGIINKDTYSQLYTLYEERNKVVHRYIISDLTTKDVQKIAFKFDEITDEIKGIVAEIEKEQIRTGKGMTISKPDHIKLEDTLDMIKKMVAEKHGGLEL